MEHLYSDPLILMLIGALAYFVRSRLSEFDKKHDKHLDQIRTLEQEAASLKQSVDDHAKVDDERFNRIEEMFRETRDDIKTLIAKP